MESTLFAPLDNFKFSDEDVCNPDDFIPAGEYNPHSVRPWLLHDHGFTVAVVFADCLQDALDIACDEDKLSSFKVDDDTLKTDYDAEGIEGLASLGNAGELHDIESLGCFELTIPPYSFAAMYAANKPKGS